MFHMLVSVIAAIWTGVVLLYLWNELNMAIWWAILLLILPVFIMLASVTVIRLQPQRNNDLSFKV
jgi:hypothetical protein